MENVCMKVSVFQLIWLVLRSISKWLLIKMTSMPNLHMGDVFIEVWMFQLITLKQFHIIDCPQTRGILLVHFTTPFAFITESERNQIC
jgi:hypothetical protein